MFKFITGVFIGAMATAIALELYKQEKEFEDIC